MSYQPEAWTQNSKKRRRESKPETEADPNCL